MMIVREKQKLFFHADHSSASGVDVTYTKSTRSLSIGGWYDAGVGIENQSIHLGDFLQSLGVRASDLRAVLRAYEADKVAM